MKKSRKIFYILMLFLSGLLGFCLSFFFHKSSPQNTLILMPPPDVQITQTTHTPYTFVNQIRGDPDAGRKIFKEFCISCHAQEPIIDIQAPRIGDKKAWEARRRMGMKALLKITISGVGAMPARGGCFECSDDQLQKAIEYILQKSS